MTPSRYSSGENQPGMLTGIVLSGNHDEIILFVDESMAMILGPLAAKMKDFLEAARAEARHW
jgi:hypothetical protein